MAVVARHAAVWVTNGDRTHRGPPLDPERGAAVVARQRRVLEDACASEGRDPGGLRRLVLTGPRLDAGLGSRAQFEETKAAYASAGVTDLVVHWPRPGPPYAGDDAVLEQIVGG